MSKRQRPLVLLICGGREGVKPPHLFDLALEHWLYRHVEPGDGIDVPLWRELHIVVGSKRGTDGQAFEWAVRNEHIATVVSAKWLKYGDAAGPMRNRRMLELFAPDFVLAYPGGKGTANMIRTAHETTRSPLWAGRAPLGIYECALDVAAKTFGWKNIHAEDP